MATPSPTPDARAGQAATVAQAAPALRYLVEGRAPHLCRYADRDHARVFSTACEGQPFDQLALPSDAPLLRDRLAQAAARGPGEVDAHLRLELDTGHGTAHFVLELTPVLHEAERLLVVTLRPQHLLPPAQELRAQLDPLTGAVDRTVCFDRLRHALQRLARQPARVAVLVFDIDHFKAINDTWGHRAGDQVLTDLAHRVAALLRPSDTLARLGGDEFAIVVEDLEDALSGRGARELAERIVRAGRTSYDVGGGDLVCTVSVGVAVTADSTRTPESLLHDADIAMYRAKNGGRDRAELFDERLRISALRRSRTESLVRDALTHRRLVLEYQPILSLHDESLVAVEALVRVQTPGGRQVDAASFLDVASDAGLMRQVDDWVLGEVTGPSSPRFAVPLTLNLSAHDVEDRHLTSRVLAALARRELPATALRLELSERELLAASFRGSAGSPSSGRPGSASAWTASAGVRRRCPACGTSPSTTSRSLDRSSTRSARSALRTGCCPPSW